MATPIHTTSSLCPVCLKRLPATLTREGHEILLTKNCPEHGSFSTVVWREVPGAPLFDSWQRPKLPHKGGNRQTPVSDGCPFDCGLCPAHNQRTCTALIEITSRCNLGCPVCFASSGEGTHRELAEVKKMVESVFKETGGCNLQLSGGEPSIHPQLLEIIRHADKTGFEFIQLNSNGLRLAEDPAFCRELKEAGLSSVFLQFDGINDTPYRALRGRPLIDVKKRAIANLSAADIGIVLVPVIVPELNTSQLWEIVRFGLEHQPYVRGVHFQPISYFGRFPAEFTPRHFTLPELMAGLEQQSGGRVHATDFVPPGCEHALCSFSAKYITQTDGSLTRLGSGSSCTCTPQPALQGAIKSIGVTARQWSSPNTSETPPKDDLERFIQRAKSHSFTISAMAFMDAWSLNLERLRGCCIHIAQPDGRLLPFCAANLTSISGRSLYGRKQ
ncbi:radical SAM protein [Desulforhopalus vacuolatus]|uniref:radical SAM (seleno)protein TrsS n=1 Tax=Desulforhopalus vacuolatus TaxID=40414 RepID=UPI00196295B7|nr:radical SAM (seleno)protein TrsS [Desulforhopalus vacuolatus]MBM9519720.1 radical SAM protein [Desulforhopalus vacuolatus]